ncbi:hypothetical protein [Mycolicibacter sinensis]|uniref:hypothetical protein n=1 Tax=Mycolicibacter sinensis (strain JDM601) TaxID=875328 RepID=UPI0007EC0DAE|nr:hypothetical protein [Mycolicibacter sinensis]OBH20795.1 hypothetical protein A5694_15570 [Mycolicibacter sinensis]
MVRKIADLRATTDEQLIREHDKRAENTVVGTGYYMDELNRRDAVRAQEASYNLARRAFWLTVANSVLATVSAVVAVAAIILSRC